MNLARAARRGACAAASQPQWRRIPRHLQVAAPDPLAGFASMPACQLQATTPQEFLPLTLQVSAVDLPEAGSAPAKAEHDIRIEVRRGTDDSATAKALDYSLKRWAALTRFADDARLPVDNNWIENQIRPIAIGRNN